MVVKFFIIIAVQAGPDSHLAKDYDIFSLENLQCVNLTEWREPGISILMAYLSSETSLNFGQN